jgi:predicted amidohydrolase
MTKVAVVQHCATTDVETNMQSIASLTHAACDAGAEIVCWAEAFAYLGSHAGKQEILELVPDGGPILDRCRALARQRNVELLLGGFHERMADDSGRCYNTSVYLSASGEVLATYRKIHLFDVAIPDGPQLMESKQTAGGSKVVLTDTRLGTLGLTICYDLRFPVLYQTLIDRGAMAISVPSAFTATTGEVHWHVLLRARAIENQCYIIAPAQHGQHSKNRASYGHSLIVDPWGTIVAEVESGDGFAIADIDVGEVERVRKALPSLANRRAFQ